MSIDASVATTVGALSILIAYLIQHDPEDYVFQRRNSEDCWYPPTCKIMTDLIPEITKTWENYTDATADEATTGVVDDMFNDYRESIPQIYQPMCIANGYNATTAQLLVDNSYAKTVVKAASLKFDNRVKYAGIRAQDIQAAVQLISAIKGSISTVTVSTTPQGVSPESAIQAGFNIVGNILGGGATSPANPPP